MLKLQTLHRAILSPRPQSLGMRLAALVNMMFIFFTHNTKLHFRSSYIVTVHCEVSCMTLLHPSLQPTNVNIKYNRNYIWGSEVL